MQGLALQKLTKRILLLLGIILVVDLLVPGVGSRELILQAVLIVTCAVVMYFRH
jgi:hypothetical protein